MNRDVYRLPCFSDIIKASFAGLSSKMMMSLYYEILSTVGGANFGGGYEVLRLFLFELRTNVKNQP